MQKKHKLLLGFTVVAGASAAYYFKGRSKKPVKLDTINKTVMDKFSKNNEGYIADLNPVAKNIFQNFINEIIKMGYAVVISSGYRSSAKQAKLKQENVKNATPGFSTHEYGIGLDINLVKDGKWLNKSTSLADWKKTGVVDLAKKKFNMRWGGEFPGYSDPIHFDLGNTYNVNNLYKKALALYGSADKIQGNKMNLTA